MDMTNGLTHCHVLMGQTKNSANINVICNTCFFTASEFKGSALKISV